MNAGSSSMENFPLAETLTVPNLNRPAPNRASGDFDLIHQPTHLCVHDDARSTCSIGITDHLTVINNQNKQSLLSVYDNSTDLRLASAEKLRTDSYGYPTIVILGTNTRADAFEKRFIQCGFPKPFRLETNGNSLHNEFLHLSDQQIKSIILFVTDYIATNMEQILLQIPQSQMVVDVREVLEPGYSTDSSIILGAYRAFGNLSDQEIEYGTERVGVAIEQSSPLSLIRLIRDLNCSSRRLLLLDNHTYDHLNEKSLNQWIFPTMATLLISAIYLLLSCIEYRHEIRQSRLFYRQASSVSGSTSITLIALAFLIGPIVEFIDLTHTTMFKKYSANVRSLKNSTFIQFWFNCRSLLVWHSFGCACLHLIFLIFSRIDSNFTLFLVGFSIGCISWICLGILSSVYLSWISERLHWKEYRFLTSYFGPFCLLLAFLHVLFHWTFDSDVFNMKLVSMILPLITLILRFTVYGMIRPLLAMIMESTPKQNNRP